MKNFLGCKNFFCKAWITSQCKNRNAGQKSKKGPIFSWPPNSAKNWKKAKDFLGQKRCVIFLLSDKRLCRIPKKSRILFIKKEGEFRGPFFAFFSVFLKNSCFWAKNGSAGRFWLLWNRLAFFENRSKIVPQTPLLFHEKSRFLHFLKTARFFAFFWPRHEFITT